MPFQIQPLNQHCPELMSLLMVVSTPSSPAHLTLQMPSHFTGVPDTPTPLVWRVSAVLSLHWGQALRVLHPYLWDGWKNHNTRAKETKYFFT